ncbi:VWA domain-containing protein [Sulfurovum sp. TSL1]|uniref:vWA domain-containing protein n=1 Tax=Sulfurovum sp. TSL1 TaxID=2826994 RepID=UPI001CC5D085|nr:VWA domain-containing protein [Sulfurovum sp. TSL1]
MPHFSQILPHASTKKYLKRILKWVILIFAIIALSTPVINRGTKSIKEEGIDIVLSLDTSGSMSLIGLNEQNYEQNRWEVVSEVVKDFISTRENDRIGLVVFGDTTTVASPLSYDSEAQMHIIEETDIGVVGKSTALIDSIVTSISLLKKSQSRSKVVILLSDGDDTASQVPLSVALKLAKKYQIKIYTVSIGESNNNMLQVISNENGAQSFVATNKEDLAQVYETINSLERSNTEHSKVKIVEHLYFYFLGVSLVSGLLLLLFVRKSEEF